MAGCQASIPVKEFINPVLQQITVFPEFIDLYGVLI